MESNILAAANICLTVAEGLHVVWGTAGKKNFLIGYLYLSFNKGAMTFLMKEPI